MKARPVSTDDLARVEERYGIDRSALQRTIEQARDDQACFEELAAKHSCELPAWEELASALEDRRAQVVEAVDRVIGETMELEDSVFGEIGKTDCIAVLRGLKEEFVTALDTRAECAKSLAAIAAAYREDGYAGSDLVDGALKKAAADLRERSHVPEPVATEYVGQLARVCGIDPPTAGLTEGTRFPDFSSRFRSESGLPLEEIANRVQQTALGLWPRNDSD
jgi:hypothetical protein